MLFALAITGYSTVITAVPFTITKSGTYTLKADLTLAGVAETAITVNASNVLIDLKNNTLSSTSSAGSTIGILLSGTANNLTIQGGTISGFVTGIEITGTQQLVQNLRLVNNSVGVAIFTGGQSVIQNCLIVGRGTTAGEGILLTQCSGIVVKNNQIAAQAAGCLNAFMGGGNNFIANSISTCDHGLELASNDKYQGNLTNGCTTPFSGGIAAGFENN